jgi:restriction system protein
MRQLDDGNVHTIKDILQALTKEFNLTEEERSTLLPSGTDRTFDNRVGWARTHLGKAGLFETVGRGKYELHNEGGLSWLPT